jgi:hypothetical protein
LEEDPTSATQATRLVVTVTDGKAAFFDSAIGTSLHFNCATGAQTMRVDKINRVARAPGE